MSTMDRELEVARGAAKAAGQVLLRYYGSAYRVTEKSADNPVTIADLESNEVLKSTILGAFPSDGWLSEETADSDERLKQKRVWIVDPLDGTKEFIGEIPEFCVCIALVEDGTPRVAVEYNPGPRRALLGLEGRRHDAERSARCTSARRAIFATRACSRAAAKKRAASGNPTNRTCASS